MREREEILRKLRRLERRRKKLEELIEKSAHSGWKRTASLYMQLKALEKEREELLWKLGRL